MVLLDSSAWIRYFKTGQLDFEKLKSVSICSPIIQEVLQGFKKPDQWAKCKNGLLALPRLSDPISLDMYLEGSEIFRIGRRKGYTIRSGVDCLIAAIAIYNKAPIHHFDRDFNIIAKFTSLEIRPNL